jgi:putative DNA primase/helicase
MEEVGKRVHAGQEVRLVEILSDAGRGMGIFEKLHGWPSPGEFAEHLKTMTEKCHGAPARDYLSGIADLYTNTPAELAAMLRSMRDRCIKEWLAGGASGQARSVCGRFALVAAAGELATGMGLTGWQAGDAEAAARTCFQSWVTERGVGNQELERAIDGVIAFIEAHGQSRFEDVSPSSGSDDALWDNNNERVVFNRAGYRAGRIYYVLPQQWKKELCKGYDAKLVAQEMIRRGLMQPGTGGKNSRMVRLNGFPKAQRLYVLTDDVMTEPSAAASPKMTVVEKLMADPDDDGLSTDKIFPKT